MKAVKIMTAMAVAVAASLALRAGEVAVTVTPGTAALGGIAANANVVTGVTAKVELAALNVQNAGGTTTKTYDGSGPITITASDLGAITSHQSLANCVPTSRKVAGMALSSDVTLKSLTMGAKTYNGSAAVTLTAGDIDALTAADFAVQGGLVTINVNSGTLNDVIGQLNKIITMLNALQ